MLGCCTHQQSCACTSTWRDDGAITACSSHTHTLGVSGVPQKTTHIHASWEGPAKHLCCVGTRGVTVEACLQYLPRNSPVRGLSCHLVCPLANLAPVMAELQTKYKILNTTRGLTVGQDLVWLKGKFRLVLPDTCIQGSYSSEKEDKSKSLTGSGFTSTIPSAHSKTMGQVFLICNTEHFYNTSSPSNTTAKPTASPSAGGGMQHSSSEANKHSQEDPIAFSAFWV
ncbi:hypothetical protein E2C01_027184 [Portunus trituberculatus]|uniref:Uncharacterized protein n=1 Tax=Portunus trituberculatus TaxID=210409 RepID=A0A5B7EKZ4_PORTR|nr:hypothetical protein [Portunus trituberculatus]